jgi:hypothetical protein
MQMIINSMQNFSCQLPFQIKEIQTRIYADFAQTTHPFAIKQEKENQKHKRKEKDIGSHDLKEPNVKSYRLQMSFTRVPTQSDRREESKGSISSSQQQKLKKNEEGHKI